MAISAVVSGGLAYEIVHRGSSLSSKLAESMV